MSAARKSVEASAPFLGPHLSATEKQRLLAALDDADAAERGAIMSRLAWRPAWAIRSRGGALSEFLGLFGIGRTGSR